MINVKYTNDFDYIQVKGHSNSAPKGQDLICASVSSIMCGLCNYMHDIYKIEDDCITIENGYTEIDLRKYLKVASYYRSPKDIIYFVIYQLRVIEQNYGEYINIEGFE